MTHDEVRLLRLYRATSQDIKDAVIRVLEGSLINKSMSTNEQQPDIVQFPKRRDD